MVDKSVIKSCKKGNQKAYKLLYDASVPYVFSIVKRYVYKQDEWKDMVQEAFAQIFSSLNKYNDQKGEFKPYLHAIVVNTCLMHLRATKKMPFLSALDEVKEEPSWDAAQNEITNISKADIADMLTGMPDGYKTIFLLHVIDEFSYKEIGKMLGITSETARSQYFRAKKWIINKAIVDKKSSSYGLF